MFRFLSVREQLALERRKNELLQAQIVKNTSDIDYVAMMSDIDLDVEEPDDTEGIGNE